MDLTPKIRAGMPSSSFGLPASKGFPMNDPEHARLAIGGATRAEHAGNISAGTAARIKGMARRKLGIKPAGMPSMNPKAALLAKLRGGL
jgi:hypothetical protein